MATAQEIKPTPKSITILGRRWFQKPATILGYRRKKSFGTTYHTVTVLVDGREVFTSDTECGHGRQYEQTAIEWLIKEGYLPVSTVYYSTREENGIAFYSMATDVADERDLCRQRTRLITIT